MAKSESTEKLIQPIRNLCSKIEIDRDSDTINHLKEIREIIKKGKFYESHALLCLTDLLKKLPGNNKSSHKIENILKELDCILHNPNGNYNLNIKNFCSFVFSLKDYPHLYEPTIKCITYYESWTNFKDAEYLCYINIKLLRFVQEIDNLRIIVIENIGKLFASCGSDKETQIFLFNQLYSTISSNIEKNSYVEDILMNLCCGGSLAISNHEVLDIYLKIIECSALKCTKACSKYVTTMQNSLKTESFQNANRILSKILELFTLSLITSKDLKEVRDAFKKEKADEVILRITRIFTKLLTYYKQFEKDSSCFSSYHTVIYDLLHIVAKIPKDIKLKPCCGDVRRHEIHSLILSIFPLTSNLIANGTYSEKDAHIVDFYVNYLLRLCSEFVNCEKIGMTYRLSYNSVYNSVLYEIFKKNSQPMILKIAMYLPKIYEVIANLYIQMPQVEKERSQNPEALFDAVLQKSQPFKENCVSHIVKCYVQLMLFSMKHNESVSKNNKLVLKYINSLRNATRVMKEKYQGATHYIKEHHKKEFEAIISMSRLQTLEIISFSRYESNSNDNNVNLVGMIRTLFASPSLDLTDFAMTCTAITYEVVKNLETEQFICLNDKLYEYSKSLNEIKIEVSLALTTNFYFIYCRERDMLDKKFNEIEDTKKVMLTGQYSKIMEHLNYRDEIRLLSYLDKSLESCYDIIQCIREDKKQAEKIISNQRLYRIIDNISHQYVYRGIIYKHVEWQNLLWHFLNDQSPWMSILNCAIVLIDNYHRIFDRNKENSLRLSRKIETVEIVKVLKQSIETFEKEEKNFDKMKEYEQAYMLDFALSLWQFYALDGNKEEGIKFFKKSLSLNKSSKFNSNQMYDCYFKCKFLFIGVIIKLNLFQINSSDILFKAIKLNWNIRTITAEFNNAYKAFLLRLSIFTLNYSLNRLIDMDHYAKLSISMRYQAATRNCVFRTAEYTSLSILRHLNMEKLEFAKLELKELSALLQTENNILIETPVKLKSIGVEVNYEHVDLTIRKAIPNVKNDHNTSILEFASSQHNQQLIDQLKKFVHKESCTCINCQYPLLKFYLFQIGCHYSRLLWLMDQYRVSMEFNVYALDHWRVACQKILRMKDFDCFSVDKKSFMVFSIRWLFQVADTFIRLEMYDEADEIYTEVDLICTQNVPDYESFIQVLICRKKAIEFLLRDKKKMEMKKKELTFDEFMKHHKEKNPTPVTLPLSVPSTTASIRKKSPTNKQDEKLFDFKTPKPLKMSTTLKKSDCVIYVDSSDEEEKTPARKAKPKNVTPATTTTKSAKKASSSKTISTESSTPLTRTRRRMI